MDAKSKIETVLRRFGVSALARLWDCSESDASRRVSGERGILLDDLAKALDAAGVQIITADDVVVSRAKYEAMLRATIAAATADLQALLDTPKRETD